MKLTEDQILTLAPDESSKKAGKDLANSSKWLTKGANDLAVWGECHGSGNKPYQTQIDLSNIAFKCSCPSRKFPCKHGIALGLLYARQIHTFKENEAPAWVAEWLSKRTEKEENKSEKKDKPVDEAAQAKRQHAREQKVADGVEELLVWVKDIIRNGIINLPDKGYVYWEGMAKRMIDAQSPGLAGMISDLGKIHFFKEGWQSTFLDGLLNIYLIAKGYQNRDSLHSTIQQDIRNWIGFTVSQEELKGEKGILDTWLITAKQVSEEDNLTVERNWLYGLNSNRHALVLQFIIRGQGANLLLSPGMYIDAEVVYYPSISPLRALIKRQVASTSKLPKHLIATWKEVAQMETTLCATFPVQTQKSYVVKQITPVLYNQLWWLKDKNDDLVTLPDIYNKIWKLLALSGGEPLDMVVIGKERQYEPVGIWDNGTYKPI